MATILFDSVIFGPVTSRRLGVSLGINLLPNDAKLCNYDCVYCECGLNEQSRKPKSRFHPEAMVMEALESKLLGMQMNGLAPDSITFAGNGEPTMHPSFATIMQGVIDLRNRYFPNAKVSVLSNATMAHRKDIYEALLLADSNMLKLDTAIEETFRKLNQPPAGFNLQKLLENLMQFRERMIIQSLFITGTANGKRVDNTTEEELQAWLRAVAILRPREVQVYTIARETPIDSLNRVSGEELQRIAGRVEQLGIPASVYA